MTEILLEKNRSKKSENVTNILPIELEGKTRLVNEDSLHDDFSLMAQYDKERDESNKFRFIFVVNPICSNVLFNVKTEAYKIVTQNGKKYYKIVTDGGGFTRDGDLNNTPINTTNEIDTLQIIRDTEYSHPSLGNLKYHCGLDIFNNHILRRNAFCHVNKLRTTTTDNKEFNTFADKLRNSKGEDVLDTIYDSVTEVSMHLYNADTLMSMKNAFLNRCKEQNGWFGFYNSTDMEIPNAATDDGNVSINRVLMDREPCEFIDFFPDRSYYSFIPQWNDVTNKAEKNWDYCITYPYENDEGKLRDAWNMALSSGSTVASGETCWEKYSEKDNGVPLKGIGTVVNGDNKKLLQIRSLTKHNLKVGSIVHLYQYNVSWTAASPTSQVLNYNIDAKIISGTRGKNIAVESIGDGTGNLKDYVFSVSYDDIIDEYDTTKPIYFKRVSNGEECKYYFRKFKKITKQNDEELNSTINKVAFGENIYGDEVAQIVFTDDVNVDGLVDNLGRPVSEVFLTIIKRNQGHKNWYDNRDTDTNMVMATDVERSCHFGRVSSGLDYSNIGSVNDEPTRYNIHYKTGVGNFDNNTTLSLGDTISEGRGLTNLESDISINDNVFYGDIVEYDKYDCKETVLSEVRHRFNTAQRELFDERYRDVFQDVIIRDDYDVQKHGETDFNKVSHFATDTFYLNDYEKVTHSKKDGVNDRLFYGNICPEGYYYKPFYSIRIKKEKNTKGLAVAKKVTLSGDTSIEPFGPNEFYITPSENYNYMIGDTIAFYSISNDDNNNIFGVIKKIDEGKVYFHIDGDTSVNSYDLPRDRILFMNGKVPNYAKLLAHSGYFIWRDLEAPSEITRGEELYDTPFMNGRFYMEKNINFFLRRQDPFGKYGLSIPINPQVMNQITTYTLNAKTKKIDTSIIDMVEKGMDVCY